MYTECRLFDLTVEVVQPRCFMEVFTNKCPEDQRGNCPNKGMVCHEGGLSIRDPALSGFTSSSVAFFFPWNFVRTFDFDF